ncbi:MAG: VWA domain-containing protein [Acidobacteriia bacterium]|nr:VWA domain-containing protein [Terriglobia bacterium]
MPFLTRFRTSAQIACLLAFGLTSFAQAPPASQDALLPHVNSPTAPELPESETLHARVDEVNVVFTVTENSGRFVSQLSLGDLDVLDNRRAPERISYFQQESDLPLRVGLLVDLSDSVTGRFEYEKKAAITFLQKVLRPNVDEAFLVGFASRVNLLQDFTGDVGALSRAVQRMKLGGDTRLYDAIKFAAAKLRGGSPMGLSRRAIIVISDGVDTRSDALMYEAIQAALHAEAALFALSSNEITPHEYPVGEAVLELVTRPTGGSVLRAHSKSEIVQAFRKIENALRSQYVVGYKPADFQRDGNFRTIQIVPRKHKLHVQCRRGYFAPREEQVSAFHATAP